MSNYSTGVTCVLGILATIFTCLKTVVAFVYWSIEGMVEYIISFICLGGYSGWVLHEHKQYCDN